MVFSKEAVNSSFPEFSGFSSVLVLDVNSKKTDICSGVEIRSTRPKKLINISKNNFILWLPKEVYSDFKIKGNEHKLNVVLNAYF